MLEHAFSHTMNSVDSDLVTVSYKCHRTTQSAVWGVCSNIFIIQISNCELKLLHHEAVLVLIPGITF